MLHRSAFLDFPVASPNDASFTKKKYTKTFQNPDSSLILSHPSQNVVMWKSRSELVKQCRMENI
jgi:hypothetical protein